MSTPEPLNVIVELPPAPFTLATQGFLATLAQVEADIKAMTVTDAESAQAAANLQTRLTAAGTALERQRKALKDPFIEAGRAIDNAAKAPAARIEAAKSKIKVLLTEFDNAERAKAAEAERVRQAELLRLEEQRRTEEAERKRKEDEAKAAADALAKASQVEVMDFDDAPPPAPTETEKAIQAIQSAPAVVAAKPSGVRFRVLLVATVTDISKLPDQFIEKTAKMAAIRATYCNGYKDGDPLPVVPGVKFEISRSPVSTGAPQF